MSKLNKKQRRNKRKAKKSNNLSYEEIKEMSESIKAQTELIKSLQGLGNMHLATCGMFLGAFPMPKIKKTKSGKIIIKTP